MTLAQIGVPQSESFTAPSVSYVGLAPILVLIGGAALILVITSLRKQRFSAGVWTIMGLAVGGCSFVTSVALWSKIDAGNKPFTTVSGAVVIDGFSVFFFGLLSLIVILTSLSAESYLDQRKLERREFYLLMFMSAAGGMCMAAANDLIVIFIGLEILSIALYVLTGYHRDRASSREAALKYFLLGALASALFLYGSALLYGATGSTNLSAIASFLSRYALLNSGLLVAGMILVLIALAFKVSLVPFHMWTPDVYQGAVTPATGFMAAAAKAAGFAAMLRVFDAVLLTNRLDWQPIVYALAVVTLIIGPFLAIKQTSIKRMLAYSSVTNAGFILLGVHAGTEKGIEGSLFYILAYSIFVLGSFMVVSVVTPIGDDNIDRFKGLSARRPALAFVFTVLLLAQTGVPLTSGFFAKFGVLAAVVEQRSYALAVIAMLSSCVAAFAYLRVIVKMYMNPPDGEREIRVPAAASAALGFTVGLTLLFGVVPQAALHLVQNANIHL
jgi:NADH-quinone oxidoreductase subunit N